MDYNSFWTGFAAGVFTLGAIVLAMIWSMIEKKDGDDQ